MLEIRPPRRAVIAYVGLGALVTAAAACSTDDDTSEPGSAASTSAPAATPGPTGSAPLAKMADVPVGSGVIVDDTVITQPTAGDFKGFSAVCTHAGCNVSRITEGKIVCPCHDSEFNLDGSVAQGPAKAPLDSKPVVVQGDSIVLG